MKKKKSQEKTSQTKKSHSKLKLECFAVEHEHIKNGKSYYNIGLRFGTVKDVLEHNAKTYMLRFKKGGTRREVSGELFNMAVTMKKHLEEEDAKI